MARKFVDKAASEALVQAIQAVEEESSVEVVIKIRHHSGSYHHADFLVGCAAAIITLTWMMLTPAHHFSSIGIVLDPALVGLAFGLLTTQLPFLRRWLTLNKNSRERVKLGAWAGFYERGVSRTRARTGMLVYASLLERDVELVCDRGIIEVLGFETIEEERLRIRDALRKNFSGLGLAKGITELKVICGQELPCGDDDINELPDQVHHP